MAKSASKKPALLAPVFLHLCEAEEKKVSLVQLVFDRRLQHRKQLFDEDTVGVPSGNHPGTGTGYCGACEMGAEFPPLSVVHQTQDEAGDKCSIYWVYDGFQRGEMYRRIGLDKVSCRVIEGGSYADALFLSLKSNSTNSTLARTTGDVRTSINVLLDDPGALALVQEQAAVKNSGGLHRMIAAAVGCGASTVMDALTARGQMVRGNKIVKKPVPAPVPVGGVDTPAQEETPASALSPTEPQAHPEVVPPTEEQRKAANDAAYTAMKAANFEDRVKECGKLSRRIAVLLASLYTDPERGALVKECLDRNGMALDSEFDVRAVQQQADFSAHYEVLEHWPVAVRLGALFADITYAYEHAGEPAASAASTEAEPEPSTNGHENGKRKPLRQKR